MTGSAVGQASMVELGSFPTAGVMAIRALPIEVVSRFVLGMAGYAVRSASHLVIKSSILPVGGVMAS